MSLISVIVPVYKAEKHLELCVDSICAQTFRDMDIILVDDGSPDRCGEICDACARRDPRVRVFHTENQGHYLARNFAIGKAREMGSRYVGFVDADDWIESDMYETLIRIAEAHDADIVECGYFWEHPADAWVRRLPDRVMDATGALCALFKNELDDYLWDKLWKITCFNTLLFPEQGRSYQDAATTYRFFAAAGTVVSTSRVLVHYRQVRDSIVHTPGVGLVNQWLANIAKYRYAESRMRGSVGEDDYRQMMRCQVRNCAVAVSENWAYWHSFSREDQARYAGLLGEMHRFSREHFPLFGDKGWPRFTRIIGFLSHFKNRLSLYLAYQVAKRRKRNKGL